MVIDSDFISNVYYIMGGLGAVFSGIFAFIYNRYKIREVRIESIERQVDGINVKQMILEIELKQIKEDVKEIKDDVKSVLSLRRFKNG